MIEGKFEINPTEGQIMSEVDVSETYATLLNAEMIMSTSSDRYFSVDKSFLYKCIDLYLSSVFVDSAWYLEKYPDIQPAVESGVFKSAAEHYRRHGYYEHRKPFEMIVDEAWYLETYPDVRSAIGSRHFSSGQNHFDTVGFREGRLPFSNFTLRIHEC
jgi:hypothetical protein